MLSRQKNPRRQGDIGEAAAIQWLTEAGACVCFPMFHSPDFDLVAEFGHRLLKVQVKTSTAIRGESTYSVQIATNGGNQSWSGPVKRFDCTRCDYLFALVADGRRWFIPASEIEGATSISLGGDKYAEFEVGGGGDDSAPSRIAAVRGSAGVGEPGRTVNPVPRAEWVRIPPPPFDQSPERGKPLASARTRASANRQITLPKRVFEAADLAVGDAFRVDALSTGRIVITRVQEVAQDHVRRLFGG